MAFLGESGAYDIQSTESSRRLSYIPQCMGSEERLEDCSTLNHAGNCDAPLLISCWNSSSDTSVIILMTRTLVSSVKLLVSPASTQTLTPYYSVKQSSSIMYYVLETKPPSELLSSSPLPTPPTGASTSGERCWLMFVYGVLVGAVVGAGITGALALCYLILRKRNIQSNEKLSGEVFKQHIYSGELVFRCME